MMKKLIATALAAAMIFGLVSVALAAGFSDIEDHARKNDILKLVSLGIIDGYPDGTFKPENPVTRAEFAKLIISTMGLGEAAQLMAGVPTPFSDVSATHWANGYINLAHSKDIVNGYPDGTFKPEAQVTYAEALKMILCAIGYTPEVLKPVYWPVTWVAKAVETGLNKGVAVSANLPAVRGDVAALLENALTIPNVVQTGFGDEVTYKVDKDATLLKALIGSEAVTGYLVDSPELFDNNGKSVKVQTTAKEPETFTFKVLNAGDVKGLLGHKVKVWVNSDNEVVFMEDLTPADSVKTASRVNGTTVKISGKEKSVLDVPMFRNYVGPDPICNADPAEEILANHIQSGDEITVIYEGDSIKYVVALGYQTGVVSSVSTVYDRIYFTVFTDTASIRLADKDVRYVGAASKLSEIKKGDVVQYIDESQDAVLIVTREAVEGELTKITSAEVATIDGAQYKFAEPAETIDVADEYGSLLGEQVKALLNKDGKIVYIASEDEAEDVEIIAAVLRIGYDSFGDPILKLLNADGTTATYSVDSEAEDCEEGDIIAYTLDDDIIDSISVQVEVDVLETTPTTDIPVKSKYHLVAGAVMTEGTAFFDYRNAFGEDGFNGKVKVIKRADIEANDKIDGVVETSSGKAIIVAMVYGDLADGSEGLGMVVATYRNAAGKYVLSVLEDGTVSDYVYGTSKPGIASKKVIEFTVSGTNTISGISELLIEALPTGADEFRVVDIDIENRLLKVQAYAKDGEAKGAAEYLVVAKDALLYDISDDPESISIEELSVNAVVDLYLDGTFVLVLVVK